MTSRSERRDRELKVIDQAVRLLTVVDKTDDGMVEMKWDEWIHFEDAVTNYCSAELAEPSATRTNLLSPETAHEAEGWAKQFALTDAGAVFRQIYYAWRRARARDHDWDDEGLTSDEIEAFLERTHQSISARVNALKNSGWVIDSGNRRKTRSGGNAIVWTPTQAARAFVEEHGMPIPLTRMEMTVEGTGGREADRKLMEERDGSQRTD